MVKLNADMKAGTDAATVTDVQVNHVSQTIAKPPVICRATFKGEVQKATFHLLLEYIDDMKLRHWQFEKHERTDLQNGNVVIDYVLVRHGI